MKIEVVPYNSSWPMLFEKEKLALIRNVGSVIKKIHHIGSTSVEGLSAKPIIDLILEVESLNTLDKLERTFIKLGYESMGELGISGRRYYRKGGDNRTHQIHAFEVGDANITRHLAFREYLKAHPEIKQDYSKLKVKVARECQNNIELYCDGKDSFIKEHEVKALNWISCA